MYHIFCWTPGVRALLKAKRAPKGRTSRAQANGLGLRIRLFLSGKP